MLNAMKRVVFVMIALTAAITVQATANLSAEARRAKVEAVALQKTGITAIDGIKVGHFTLKTKSTGCTVVLTEAGATGGVDVRGAAPGTRETDLLNPQNAVEQVHGIVLTGGSAFGLDVATGVMKYLEERKVGFPFGGAYVPIVPAAVIFDLPVEGKYLIRPDASCGYEAAKAATAGPVAEGTIGAGAGATVGKFAGGGKSMKGGIGTASITLKNGLTVAAIVVTNAAGDIIDPANGKIVAGARGADGKTFIDARVILRSGGTPAARAGENTTIGVVATNAKLTKAQAQRMASMAHDGIARAIYPAHTMVDGDTVFGIATGGYSGEVNMTIIGGLAAEAMSDAILRSVREATGLPGIPSVRELAKQ